MHPPRPPPGCSLSASDNPHYTGTAQPPHTDEDPSPALSAVRSRRAGNLSAWLLFLHKPHFSASFPPSPCRPDAAVRPETRLLSSGRPPGHSAGVHFH